jgi:hypothetical protein
LRFSENAGGAESEFLLKSSRVARREAMSLRAFKRQSRTPGKARSWFRVL